MNTSSKRLLLMFAHCNITSKKIYNIEFLINNSTKFRKQSFLRGRKSKVNQMPLINISNYNYPKKITPINERKTSYLSENRKLNKKEYSKGKYCSSSLTSGNPNLSNENKFNTMNENIGQTNYLKHVTKSENFDSLCSGLNHSLSKNSNKNSIENKTKNYLKSKGVRLKLSLQKASNQYEIKANNSEAKSIDYSEESIHEISFNDSNQKNKNNCELDQTILNCNENLYMHRNIFEERSGISKEPKENTTKTEIVLPENNIISLENISKKNYSKNKMDQPSNNMKPKTHYSKINKRRIIQYLSNHHNENKNNSQDNKIQKNKETIESQEETVAMNKPKNLFNSIYQKYLLKFAEFTKNHHQIQKKYSKKSSLSYGALDIENSPQINFNHNIKKYCNSQEEITNLKSQLKSKKQKITELEEKIQMLNEDKDS